MLSPSQAQVIKRFIRSELMGLHLGCPAEVISYDEKNQLANVKVLFKRAILVENEDTEVLTPPNLTDVPVMFPNGGEEGWSITWELSKGDKVWLIFSERNMETYLKTGRQQIPPDGRIADISDAIILPGIPQTGKNKSPGAKQGLLLSNSSGSVKLSLDATGITIEAAEIKLGEQATSEAAKGTELKAFMESLVTWMSTHTHTEVTPVGSAPTTPPISPPPQVPSNIVSSKTKVE